MSDLISRTEIISTFTELGKTGRYGGMCEWVIEIVKQLPPAALRTNLAEVGTDCISREQAIDAIEAEKTKRGDYLTSSYVGYEIAEKVVAKLPPAEPKRGRWIPVTNGRGGYECDQCHEYAPSYQNGDEHLSNFCPNCGAKMEVTT